MDKLFLFFLLLTTSISASLSQPDSNNHHSGFVLGAGPIVGLSYQLNQPKQALVVAGSNFGFGVLAKVQLTNCVGVKAETRFLKTENVYKFRTGIDPDFFNLSTETFQLPLVIDYLLFNKNKKHIIGIDAGFSFNWNRYSAVYNMINYGNPGTVPFTEMNVKTKDFDNSVIIGVFRQYETKGNMGLRYFFESQINFNTKPFRNKINDANYLLAFNDDNFLPLFFRGGVYVVW